MEIERKWLLDSIPTEFSKVEPIPYLRYIVYSDDSVELRVQKKGTAFEIQRMVKKSNISRINSKMKISENEFLLLSRTSDKYISRKSYTIGNRAVKVYNDEYTGLIRYEVEFKSEKEAKNYQPPSWVKVEITGNVLANDSKLINLNREIFLQELNKLI